jgi:ribosomal protein S18 acetylase RimI-like enzyme
LSADPSVAVIRRATRADLPAVLECLAAAFEPYRSRYTPAAFEDTVLTLETAARRLQEMTIFVAETEAQLIAGTIAVAAAGSGEGHVRGMAVYPAFQGSGVARQLLDAAERELKALGCSRVTLDTTQPLERAIRFYERCGYRATGVVRDFFGMPLFEYAKDLEP